jgi:hypothetical protein
MKVKSIAVSAIAGKRLVKLQAGKFSIQVPPAAARDLAFLLMEYADLAETGEVADGRN